jgi:hypothetical protein
MASGSEHQKVLLDEGERADADPADAVISLW